MAEPHKQYIMTEGGEAETAPAATTQRARKGANGVAVYVASCDAYSDLWPGFDHCFTTFWNDCPYPVYFGTEAKTVPLTLARTLKCADVVWTRRVRSHLLQLQEPVILFMLDDFFIRRQVNSEGIDRLATLMAGDPTIAMLRLITRPGPDRASTDISGVGECAHGTPYRICTQAALWRREVLIELLSEPENIWQFEMRVQNRAAPMSHRFLCVTKDLLPYRGYVFHHVVEKGQWITSEYVRFRLAGVPVCGSPRPVMRLAPFAGLLFAEVTNQLLRLCFGRRAASVRELIKSMVPDVVYQRYRNARGYPR